MADTGCRYTYLMFTFSCSLIKMKYIFLLKIYLCISVFFFVGKKTVATSAKISNPLITFVPFHSHIPVKFSACQRTHRAGSIVQTALPTQVLSKQTSHMAKQTTHMPKQLMVPRKLVVSNRITKYGVKPENCVRFNNVSNRSPVMYSNTKLNDINVPIKGHVIHKPVAIRPEVIKRIPDVSNSTVSSDTRTTPSTAVRPISANTKQIQNVPTDTMPVKPLKSIMAKGLLSSRMNMSFSMGVPSSVTASRELSSSSIVMSRTVSSSDTGLNLLTTTSGSVLKDHNTTASSHKVTSLVSSGSKSVVNSEVLPSSRGAGLNKHEKYYAVFNTNESNKLIIKMKPFKKGKSSENIASSPFLVNENKNLRVHAQVTPGKANLVRGNDQLFSQTTNSYEQTDSSIFETMHPSQLQSIVTPSCKTHVNQQTGVLEIPKTESQEDSSITKQSLSGEKKLTCRECNTQFVKHLAYHTHMISHVRNNPVKRSQYKKQTKCSYCGKHFVTAFMLKTHMYTHTGERPYMCPYCNRAFTDSSNCRAHVKIHTDKKRIFSCTLCSKSFTQRRYLYKHMMDVCQVPTRMLRTALMSVTCSSEQDNLETFVRKKPITKFSNKISEHSVSEKILEPPSKHNEMFSKNTKMQKVDMINCNPAVLNGKPNPCVQLKRLEDEKIGLPPRKSRKQDLSKTRVFLPKCYEKEKSLRIKCVRIDDEYPYLRPLFKEMISNCNAFLTLRSSEEDATGKSSNPAVDYQLRISKPPKVIPPEDVEAVKAAKLAAAKAWQARLVNGDFTTDEENEEEDFKEDNTTVEDDDESNDSDIKRSSYKRKRTINNSDESDLTSDDDFNPKTGIGLWSNRRRRRLKRSVKHVNFKLLHYGTATDSENSNSSDMSQRYLLYHSKKSYKKSKTVRKRFSRKNQVERKSLQQHVKRESSVKGEGQNKFNASEHKTPKSWQFGKTDMPINNASPKIEEESKVKSMKEPERFHCVECNLKFLQQTNLVLHIVTTHLHHASYYQRQYFGSEQFVCKYCEKACYTFQSYIQHVPVHTTVILEKMAQHVISKSGYLKKNVSMNKEKILKEKSKPFDEYISPKRFDLKPKTVLPVASDKMSVKEPVPSVSDTLPTAKVKSECVDIADYASVHSSEKKVNYSFHNSPLEKERTLTGIQDCNIKAEADVKPNIITSITHMGTQYSSISNNEMTNSNNQISGSSTKHQREREIQLNETKNKGNKQCESQSEIAAVNPKCTQVPALRLLENSSTVHYPKPATTVGQTLTGSNNSEVNLAQSTDKKTVVTQSSTFIDSFLSYVQIHERQRPKPKISSAHYCNKIKCQYVRGNTSQHKIESMLKNCVLTSKSQTITSPWHTGRTEKHVEDNEVNLNPANKPKFQVITNEKHSSDKIPRRSAMNDDDDKNCDSVGQVSFSNCSLSVENPNSSDIIVFGAHPAVSGTDGQTLDELTQLRISKNKIQPVALESGEALNFKELVHKTCNEKKQSGHVIHNGGEESLLDTDAVLNTMLNLGSNICFTSNFQHSENKPNTTENKVDVVSQKKECGCVDRKNHVLEKQNCISPLTKLKMSSSSGKSSLNCSTFGHLEGNSNELHNTSPKKVCTFLMANFKQSKNIEKSEILSNSKSCSFRSTSVKSDVHVQHIVEMDKKTLMPGNNTCSRVDKISDSSEKSDNSPESSSFNEDLLNQNFTKTTCEAFPLSKASQACGKFKDADIRNEDIKDSCIEVCCEDTVQITQSCDRQDVLSQFSEAEVIKNTSKQVVKMSSEDLQDMDAAADVAIECEATLEATPLISQIVSDLSDVGDHENKPADEMAISCEGTLKSVIVNISIDEANSDGPVLIEDGSAQLPFTSNTMSSVCNNTLESHVSTEDSLNNESDASLIQSQHNHNIRRPGRPQKPKYSTEWYCKNLSSKKNLTVKTLIKRRKYKSLHSHFTSHNVPSCSALRAKSKFKHIRCCSTRHSKLV